MQLQIESQENEAVIRLPASLLEQLGAGVGDMLHVQLTTRGLTLSRRAPKPHYTLEELLAQDPAPGDPERS